MLFYYKIQSYFQCMLLLLFAMLSYFRMIMQYCRGRSAFLFAGKKRSNATVRMVWVKHSAEIGERHRILCRYKCPVGLEGKAFQPHWAITGCKGRAPHITLALYSNANASAMRCAVGSVNSRSRNAATSCARVGVWACCCRAATAAGSSAASRTLAHRVPRPCSGR